VKLDRVSTRKIVDMNYSKSVGLFGLFVCVCSSSLINYFLNPQPAVAQEIKLPDQANQDDTWTCGANSASRVLKYYGHKVSYPDVRGVAQHDHGIIPTKVCIGGGKTCFLGRCIKKPEKCFNTSGLKTGLEPDEVRKILARWEGGNAKLSTRANFEDLKARVREGKPVIVLKRVNSFRPGEEQLGVKLFGTWPVMHWVTVHGLNESAQRIYYTDTENNSKVEDQSYSDFLSQWDWSIGDGLANETIWGKGIRPKTMVWVDRTIAAQIQSFQKPGNNGSVSCNTFCGAAKANGQPVWGDIIGVNIGSNQPKGAAGICECAQASNLFVKHGNNGTVTCDTYCRGSQWGQVGTCVASFDNKNGSGRDGNYLPGFLNGPELTCTCVK
jgi:Peptidase_C39 like family